MKKHYTFLLIPHGSGGRSIEFNLNKFVVIGSITFILLLFVTFGATLYLSTKLTGITVKYYQIENKNQKILHQLQSFEDKTENLKKVVLNLKEQDQEIRKLLGVRSNRRYFPVSLKKK